MVLIGMCQERSWTSLKRPSSAVDHGPLTREARLKVVQQHSVYLALYLRIKAVQEPPCYSSINYMLQFLLRILLLYIYPDVSEEKIN